MTETSSEASAGTRKKRLILLLDGTWNDWEASDDDTNIVRLEDRIIRNLQPPKATQITTTPEGQAASTGQVTALRSANYDNYVFYQRGVGTGISDKFTGGIFGEGLGANIRRAYKFLSFNYADGDEIFVFGFSRGAYTARSVIGYIAAAGLLKRESCTADNEERAWSFYRTPPADRMPADWVDLTDHVHKRETFRINLIGVFDTVGALGVPLGWFDIKNRQKYAFHDVNLSSITNVNLHALAIDEQRKPFSASIWRRPRYKQYDTKTEQVWFPGVHADIGGGYFAASKRNNLAALDDITLDWMIRRLKTHFPEFPIDIGRDLDPQAHSRAERHNSRQRQYRLFPRAYRAMANVPVKDLRPWQTAVSYDRRDGPIEENVHISALQRLGQPDGFWSKGYWPKNLVPLLSMIEDTYHKPDDTYPKVFVIDWNGDRIDSIGHPSAAAMLQVIADAKKRRGIQP